jgi:hydroxyacylglutathione hydrolase
MLFRLFYDQQLAQASYLIGCQATGEGIVVDPTRDIEQYLAAATAEGIRITAVTETHIHADFVSGSRELSAKAQATMYLSNDGPQDWKYAFRSDPLVSLIVHGTRISIGNIILEAVHTPGHTPEHMSFLVTDGAASTEPMGILTGDFVFVGDVGRPDLLEKAARVAGASDGAARQLFHSITWFKQLPSHWQVWPGHGAGSACGKGIGAVPQSTVGYELRTNWAMGIDDEQAFVDQVLYGQPEPPAYFGKMKLVNRDGPRVLGGFPTPQMVGVEELERILDGGGIVVDTRSMEAFTAEHIPRCLNIPFDRAFATSAGSIVPYDQDFILLVDGPDLDLAIRSLVMIGLDRVTSYLDAGGVTAWKESGRRVALVPQMTVNDLNERVGESPFLLDVRGESEWRGGHIDTATLIPLPELSRRLDEVPRDRPVLVHCQGGGRSAIAASLLLAKGWPDVSNLAGGFSAWLQAGRSVLSSRG